MSAAVTGLTPPGLSERLALRMAEALGRAHPGYEVWVEGWQPYVGWVFCARKGSHFAMSDDAGKLERWLS